jgi:hypothetical protein
MDRGAGFFLFFFSTSLIFPLEQRCFGIVMMIMKFYDLLKITLLLQSNLRSLSKYTSRESLGRSSAKCFSLAKRRTPFSLGTTSAISSGHPLSWLAACLSC